jgi:hypothetical protein
LASLAVVGPWGDSGGSGDIFSRDQLIYMLFKARNSKKEESPKPAGARPDFLVRNMPKPRMLSGNHYQAGAISSPSSRPKEASAGNNFKKVGLVIIIGGLAVVCALIYLSYRLIIKPSAERLTAPTAPVADSSPAGFNAPSQPVEPIVTAIDISSSTAVDLTSSSSSLLVDTNASSTVASSTATTSDDNLVTAPVPVADSDSDGLTDDEEFVLGTNPNSADSDGDTYDDLGEINNNYNPASAGRLAGNPNLVEYRNPVGGYQVLYPKNWLRESLDDDRTVIFKAADDSLMQISLQDNTDKQSIVGWYGGAFPDSLITYDKLKNASNWEGIAGDDGRNFYLNYN